MASKSDRFGRDKASQRRKKIPKSAPLPADPILLLKRGDPVRWPGHEGVVERVVGDTVEIAESAAGRTWRLPLASVSRR